MSPTTAGLFDAPGFLGSLTPIQSAPLPELTSSLDDPAETAFQILLAQLLSAANLSTYLPTQTPTQPQGQSVSDAPANPNISDLDPLSAESIIPGMHRELAQGMPGNTTWPGHVVPDHQVEMLPIVTTCESCAAQHLEPTQPVQSALSIPGLSSTVSVETSLSSDESPTKSFFTHGSIHVYKTLTPLLQQGNVSDQAFSMSETLVKAHARTEAVAPTAPYLEFPSSTFDLSPAQNVFRAERLPPGISALYPQMLGMSVSEQSVESAICDRSESSGMQALRSPAYTVAGYNIITSTQNNTVSSNAQVDQSNKGKSTAHTPGVASEVTAAILRHAEVSERHPVVTVRLRLEPPDLGYVQIHLRLQGNSMEAHLQVENPATLTILEQQREQLHDSLAQLGISVKTFVISFHGNESQQHAYREDAQPLPIKKSNRLRAVQSATVDGTEEMAGINVVA